MSKKQRVVIVTGGGSGIGRATAEHFALSGDIVYIFGRKQNTLEEVAKQGTGTIIPIKCDVTSPKDIDYAIDQVVQEHKTIDVLVNCAGATSGLRPDMSLGKAHEAWNDTIGVNLTGSYLMIFATRPHLARPGGRIINISSIAAFSGSSQTGGEAYSAAKAGLHGMMRTLVKEFAPQGITINCVAPGFIADTKFFSSAVPMSERIERAEKAIPAGRVGHPGEVADAIFFLASDEASYINGDIVNINGGWQFSR